MHGRSGCEGWGDLREDGWGGIGRSWEGLGGDGRKEIKKKIITRRI